MNASRVSPFRRSLCTVVLAAVVLAAPGGVWAQQEGPPAGKPLRLGPPQELKPAGEAADALPATPVPLTVVPKAAEPAGPAPATMSPGLIQVDTLSTIDPDTAGVLSEDEGGFGIAMWAGTGRALVDTLLPRLPVNATSATMRDLMRRLLLSTAQVPQGESESGGLVALRVRLLAAMGDTSGVDALLKATPGRNQNEQLMRIEADARFLANDNARACALAAGQIREQDSAYWQKAFIFCQALAGENDKAALGVALLREMGEEDAVFFDLVGALASGKTPTIESLPDPSPLHLAMARVVKAQLPPDVISSNRPAVLRTVAVSPNAPVELRLEAAERAAAAGALAVDALRQLYTSISFSDEELANPLSKAEAESGPLSRALLYRTSLVQTVPAAQAEAVARALSLAREGGRYASTVRVFMPVIKRIPPSAELLWFAPEAVRALLINGDRETALVWLGVLRASGLFNQEAKAALTALSPVVRLAGSGVAQDWSPEGLTGWWEGEKDKEGARQRAALLYSLFGAFDETVPAASWEALLDGPQRITVAMPSPALWYRLASAADNARVGETVLLALLALGEGGPGQADPVILRRVLASLRGSGLEDEARALAVEAAVEAGL